MTFGFVAIFTFAYEVKAYVIRNLWTYFLAYGVFLVSICVISCCGNVRRQHPWNLVALVRQNGDVFTTWHSVISSGLMNSFTCTGFKIWAMEINLSVELWWSLFEKRRFLQSWYSVCSCLLSVHPDSQHVLHGGSDRQLPWHRVCDHGGGDHCSRVFHSDYLLHAGLYCMRELQLPAWIYMIRMWRLTLSSPLQQTKYDFTSCYGTLFVCLIVLILFSILCIIFQTKVLQIVYAGLGALLFTVVSAYSSSLPEFGILYKKVVLLSINLYQCVTPPEIYESASNSYI